MENTDKILYTAIISYTIIMAIIIFLKPNYIYDNVNKKFKSFDETIISLPIFGTVLPVIIYFLILLYTFLIVKLT